MLSKRDLIISASCFLILRGRAEADAGGDPEYKDYALFDYFDKEHSQAFGRVLATKEDREAALALANTMPTDTPLNVMQALSEIKKIGSTGEAFNSRWKTVGNPLIVLFFHDIGYKKTPYPGDCTPWCAATISWCLRRCGKPLPPDPASSQSYLRYGKSVALENAENGDLCVFTDIRDRAHGHVTMFMEGGHAGYINCLGGNQEGKSETNCGAGYRKSKIYLSNMKMVNSYHRLASIRRYV